MSIIDRIFGDQEIELPDSWKVLDSIEQLEELKNLSENRPVAIFKHSTRCGISHMAKHQLEKDWDFAPGELDFYFLDLIRHRAVSNAVADTFGVVHQSPQVILLRNGKAVYHTSHHRIGVPDLKTALRAA